MIPLGNNGVVVVGSGGRREEYCIGLRILDDKGVKAAAWFTLLESNISKIKNGLDGITVLRHLILPERLS